MRSVKSYKKSHCCTTCVIFASKSDGRSGGDLRAELRRSGKDDAPSVDIDTQLQHMIPVKSSIYKEYN